MENKPEAIPEIKVEQGAENLKPLTLAESFRDNFSFRFATYLFLPSVEQAVLSSMGVDSFITYQVQMATLLPVFVLGEGYAFTHWLKSKLYSG